MTLKDINIKKLILQTMFLLTCFISVMMMGCCTYYSDPYVYANPKHKFETSTKRYERKLRRLDRRNTKTIDPLRMHHHK